MTDSIWKEYRLIEKERRDKMRELMEEYDKTVYYPACKAIREKCATVDGGHNFRFIDLNPLGYPIFTCSKCGKTEIRQE